MREHVCVLAVGVLPWCRSRGRLVIIIGEYGVLLRHRPGPAPRGQCALWRFRLFRFVPGTHKLIVDKAAEPGKTLLPKIR